MIVSSAGTSGMPVKRDTNTLLYTGDILPVRCPQINSSNVISHQFCKLVGKDLCITA